MCSHSANSANFIIKCNHYDKICTILLRKVWLHLWLWQVSVDRSSAILTLWLWPNWICKIGEDLKKKVIEVNFYVETCSIKLFTVVKAGNMELKPPLSFYRCIKPGMLTCYKHRQEKCRVEMKMSTIKWPLTLLCNGWNTLNQEI